ncbi:MAG: M48 family metalloprotease [Candidatus Omnitrophica bacterium]|nr:M48 family metalloprotease [Candidatus Omnitrophota bacterium]
MSFSFIDIEERKTKQIFFLFIFLVLFYFFSAWILTIVARGMVLLRIKKAVSTVQLFTLSPKVLFYIFSISLVVGMFHWFYSTHANLPRIIKTLKAQNIDKEDKYHKILRNVIDEVSVATGGRQIGCVVIPVYGMNAFSIADFSGNSVIGVTEGLLSRLTRAQLEAVIAHEAAHIVTQDTLIKTVAVSLFSIYGSIRYALAKGMRGAGRGSRGGAIIYMAVLYGVASALYSVSKLIGMFISRQCEYRADAVATRLVRDPLSLAQALRRISIGWRAGGMGYDSLESLFIINPNFSKLDEEEGALSNMFSTHPPVMRRIGTLLDMGHSDFSALKKNEGTKRKRYTDIRVAKVREPKWFVADGGKWSGPFPIHEMLTMGTLRFDSFIRPEGTDKTMLLSDDKNLVDKLKQKAPTGTNTCPRCAQSLSKVLYEGVPTLQCTICHGMFVSDDKMARIVTREEQGFPQEVIRKAKLIQEAGKKLHASSVRMKHELLCPKCGEVMVRHFYTFAYHVEVDTCSRCHATWFDVDELEIVQYMVENARNSNNLT